MSKDTERALLEARENEVLRRLLSTPPEPRTAKAKPAKPKPKKKPA